MAKNGAAITFAPALNGQTTTLSGGELALSENLTVDGSALANGIAINGNHASRIFEVATGTVTLNSLTIANGLAPGRSLKAAEPLNHATGLANLRACLIFRASAA